MVNVFYDLVLVGVVGSIISGLIVGLILKINWKILFLKFRLRLCLKNYDKTRKEKYTKKFGILLQNGKRKLQLKNFYWVDSTENNIKIGNIYEIHLTRPSPNSMITQFVIKNSDSSESYYSENYPTEQKEKSRELVLKEFIKVLKKI